MAHAKSRTGLSACLCAAAMSAGGLVPLAAGQTFSGCGELTIGPQGCPWFASDDGKNYFIEETGLFMPGDRVWVQGTLNPQSFLCGPVVGPGIEDNTIGKCFEDCGQIVAGPQGCPMLQTPQGSFLIENASVPTPAAPVWVQGWLNPESKICFPITAPGIEDNAIGPCFEGCGVLVPGVNAFCVFLRANGCGGMYLLENRKLFQVGDAVRVRGALDKGCFSICLQGNGCLEDNTIVKGCPADLNCDGRTDQSDLGLLLSCYESGPCGDLDGDCQTGQSDLGLLLADFGCDVN